MLLSTVAERSAPRGLDVPGLLEAADGHTIVGEMIRFPTAIRVLLLLLNPLQDDLDLVLHGGPLIFLSTERANLVLLPTTPHRYFLQKKKARSK